MYASSSRIWRTCWVSHAPDAPRREPQLPPEKCSPVTNFLLRLLVSNTFLDLIVLGVIAEGAALIAYRRVTGRGLSTRAVLANLFSGGSLVVALRVSLETSVLAEEATAAVAICLSVALVAHIADLVYRWDHAGDNDRARSKQA